MPGVAIFLGLILLLVAVWFGAGSTQRPIVYPTSTGTSTEETRAATIFEDALQGGDASPYRGLVTLNRNDAGPRRENARDEYIIARFSRGTADGLRITGWRIENSRGVSLPIPQGAATIRVGSVNAVGDIVLLPGDELILQTGRSPVGNSFRENACTGYLEEHQDFAPSLEVMCPHPSSDLTRFAPTEGEECRTAIRNLSSCETVTDAPRGVPASCEQFVETYLNHNGCVAAHESDPDFMNSTWRVFLGQSSEFYANERETIKLLDETGKIIDVLSY